MRECGMLLPIASLPSKYGIGCFSKEAYEFVDQLKEGGQSFWQILPLGPTGFGDSPYQAFSAFAGNPYFIDLEQLVGEGLLTEDECEEADFGDDDRYIAYDKIYKARFKVLKKAYERWKKDHHQFLKSKLDPETIEYCFYMAVKDHFKSASWNKWDKDIRLRKPAAVEKYKKMLADEIGFYEFQQFEFNEQWSRLKAYANENGIRIIGEVTADKVRIVQDADYIYREEIAKAGLAKNLGQYFAALTNMRSVGVMGDERTYDYAIALRAVNTSDFMTADCSEIPFEVLQKVMTRIINEVKGVNRVMYDLTSKPPGTIEFE